MAIRKDSLLRGDGNTKTTYFTVRNTCYFYFKHFRPVLKPLKNYLVKYYRKKLSALIRQKNVRTIPLMAAFALGFISGFFLFIKSRILRVDKKKKLRIGIDLSCLGSESSRTRGFGIYVTNFVNNLMKIDSYNQYVLFYRGVDKPLFSGPNIENCIVTNASAKGNRFFTQNILFPIEILRKKVDLMHFPVQIDLPFLKLGCKRVVTVHDLIPLLFPKKEPVGITQNFL